jgi:hypothetical protein
VTWLYIAGEAAALGLAVIVLNAPPAGRPLSDRHIVLIVVLLAVALIMALGSSSLTGVPS